MFKLIKKINVCVNFDIFRRPDVDYLGEFNDKIILNTDQAVLEG